MDGEGDNGSRCSLFEKKLIDDCVYGYLDQHYLVFQCSPATGNGELEFRIYSIDRPLGDDGPVNVIFRSSFYRSNVHPLNYQPLGFKNGMLFSTTVQGQLT